MASIKRRSGSQNWVACFTLPNGQRRQVSTGLTDDKAAFQIALAYEKAAGMAAAAKLNQRTARRVLTEIAAITGSATPQATVTVGAFLAERLRTFPSRFRGRTAEKFAFALRHFTDKSGMADSPLDAVGREQAGEWVEMLRAEGLSPATINGHLQALRTEFAEAEARGLIDRNPWRDTRIRGTRKRAQHRHAFTFQQFRDLVTALGLADCPIPHADEWRLLVLVAGYTGQRRNDCLRLTVEQIDQRAGLIRFFRAKTNDWHVAPVHPALGRELAVALKERQRGPVFPALSALPPTGRRSVSDQFRQRVLPLVGIAQPYEKAGESRARRLAPYSFHSLRHSLSTWLNQAGASDVTRMLAVGHSDAGVSRGYTHAQLEDARKAIELLPALQNEPATLQGPQSSPNERP